MSMKIVIGARLSGKSTQCRKMLEENPDAILIVPFLSMVQTYPKKLQDRIVSANSRILFGRQRKLIIDGADFIDDKHLWQLSPEQILFVATTLGKSYDKPDTWLRRMIMIFGYTKLKSKLNFFYDSEYLSQLSVDGLNKEFFASFKDLYKSARI